MNYGIPEAVLSPVLIPSLRNTEVPDGEPEHNAPEWVRLTSHWKESCGSAGSAVLRGVAAICPPGYMSLQAAREQVGAGDSIYNAVKAGRLHSQRIGRYVFVRLDDVERYIERRKA